MSWVIAFIAAVIATGFVSRVSHSLSLTLPSIILFYSVPFFALFYRGGLDLRWSAFPFAAVFLGIMSSMMTGAWLRGVVFTLVSFLPFAFLVLSPVSMEGFMRRFTVISLVMIVLWVFANAAVVGEIKPWAIESAAGTSNLFAAQLNMLWPVMAFFAGKYGGWKKSLIWVLITLAVICIVLLFSRSAVTICLIMLAVLVARKSWLITLAALFSAGVFAIVFSDVLLDFLRLYRLIDYESSYPRTLIWNTAFEQLDGNWLFGIGPGNAKEALSSIDMYHAHNNIVHVALEMGLLLAFVVALFHIYLAYMAVKMWFSGENGKFLAFSILSYLGYSLVATPLTQPGMTFTLVIVIIFARTMSVKKTALIPARSLEI